MKGTLKAILIVLVMAAVAWVPPVLGDARELFRWQDDAGVVHYSDRPADVGHAGSAARRSPSDRARHCAHIRHQLARVVQAGMWSRARVLEEQWIDECR